MKNKLTNEHALLVAQCAFKWLEHSHKNWPDDKDMLKAGTSDYLDLMGIAIKIEQGAPKQKIAKEMWNLDTIVRDQIPNSVYNFYTNNNT